MNIVKNKIKNSNTFDYEYCDIYGNSFLTMFLTTEQSDDVVLKFLQGLDGVNLKIGHKTKFNNTVLIIACFYGMINTVNYLLEQYGLLCLPGEPNNFGYTCLKILINDKKINS